MAEEKGKPNVIRALLNGLLAYLLGFIIYMIPGFVVAMQMGAELGPKIQDPEEISKRINEAIPIMYQENLWFYYGFIIVTAALIFWRSRAVTKKAGEKVIANGILVATIPVILGVYFDISVGVGLFAIVTMAIYLAAGFYGVKKYNFVKK